MQKRKSMHMHDSFVHNNFIFRRHNVQLPFTTDGSIKRDVICNENSPRVLLLFYPVTPIMFSVFRADNIHYMYICYPINTERSFHNELIRKIHKFVCRYLDLNLERKTPKGWRFRRV